MSDASRTHNKNHYDKESFSFTFSRLFLSALKSAIASLAISLLLAAVLSAAANLSSDPLALVPPLSMLSLYAASFLSGLLCVRKMREGALLCGLFSGGMLMLFYTFISFFMPSELSSGRSFWLSLTLRALIIIFSFLGAHAGRQRKIKRKMRR